MDTHTSIDMIGHRAVVPLTPHAWDKRHTMYTESWTDVPALSPFVLADGSGVALQQTCLRVCHDFRTLYVRFDCEDRDIWGTYNQRDEPIYDEEVVELFIAAGESDPIRYLEFDISPNGVLFDARIYNPTSERHDIIAEMSWDCDGVQWHAERRDADHRWWASLAIPWGSIRPPGKLPAIWRADFFRIERPRDGPAEFSCWSPTMTEPADFHKPAFFGTLVLEGIQD